MAQEGTGHAYGRLRLVLLPSSATGRWNLRLALAFFQKRILRLIFVTNLLDPLSDVLVRVDSTILILKLILKIVEIVRNVGWLGLGEVLLRVDARDVKLLVPEQLLQLCLPLLECHLLVRLICQLIAQARHPCLVQAALLIFILTHI